MRSATSSVLFPRAARHLGLAAVGTLWLAVVCGGQVALAEPWEAQLEGGREISVDPRTNRVIIESGAGQGRPLWDGVHRMSDGSVITIRSGVMVPNEEVMALRRGEPTEGRPVPEGASASCDVLVLKTCGLNEECAGSEACDLARQLRAMQWQETRTVEGGLPWAAERCEQGLADPEMFNPCAASPSLTDACDTLVRRVCGSVQRCATSKPCQLARDLLDLEQTAQRQGADQHAADTRRQCQEVLGEHAFFPPCR